MKCNYYVISSNLLILLFLISIASFTSNETQVQVEVFPSLERGPTLKIMDYWVLTGNPIFIDNDGGSSGALTWAEASAQPWCNLVDGIYIIENVTIDGQGSSYCIYVKDSTVPFIIRECTLSNVGSANSGACIKLNATSNGKIRSNNCTNSAGSGISLWDNSNSNDISKNYIQAVTAGVYFYDSCDNNNITQNTILECDWGVGINAYSHNTRIIENNMSNCVESGISSSVRCRNFTITHNYITGGSDTGITVGYTNYTVISENFIEGFANYGIQFFNYGNNTIISSNEITNIGSTGINIFSNCMNFNIENNKLTDCIGRGIYISSNCMNFNIEDNLISGSTEGIYLDSCNENNITRNDISGGTGSAIVLVPGSDNLITKNVIYNRPYGISLASGSLNNLIYWNAILTSLTTASSASLSSWDNGVIGNYYSDYSATDTNNDGIADSARSISGGGGSTDNFPLFYNPVPGEKIQIDGSGVNALNWTRTKLLMHWLDGSGTDEDPYRIENVKIDSGNSGDCIIINNSRDHFVIEGCTAYNAYLNCGIKLINTTNGTLIGNNCSFNSVGIYLKNCENNSIIDNTIHSNAQPGIYVIDFCTNIIISQNNVYNNKWGIFLEGETLDVCFENSISKNKVSENDIHGITLRNSSFNIISENNVSNNGRAGILFEVGSDNNTITMNSVFSNTEDGINVKTNSVNNTVSENEIRSNKLRGIFLETNSNDNVFSENIFIDNGIHAIDNSTYNHWDNGTIGNYWSDYQGVGAEDANDDGIGDIPYIINGDALSTDNLPIWWDSLFISIESPSAMAFFSTSSPIFDFDITRGVKDTIWYSVDGGLTNTTLPQGTNSISPFVWSSEPDGYVTVNFYVNDSRGFEDSVQITIQKETVLPVISIATPITAGTFVEYSPIFEISIVEPNLESIWYSIDGGETNVSCQLTGSINTAIWEDQPNGAITITFYAQDEAGNIGVAEVIVYKDSPYTSTTEPTTTESTSTDSSPFPNLVPLVIIIGLFIKIRRNKKR